MFDKSQLKDIFNITKNFILVYNIYYAILTIKIIKCNKLCRIYILCILNK